MNSLIISLILFNIAIDCNAIDVKTSSGVVRGQTIDVFNQKVNQFLGIPFAEPPIGDLRFAKPKPIDKPLANIIDATKTKNSCPQNVLGDLGDFLGNITQSEDCLVLNVWSQNSNTNSSKLKPVMFWIYGGALTIGSIFQTLYNGSVLATKDVVFVSTNYRLGPFGFLYGNDSTAPGNVGFYDQNLALKWVRDNIHLFGGDKNEITIFGQSAGSWSVSAQLLSPESKGLFKRAIMQSGAVMFNKDRPVVSTSEALAEAKQLAKGLNCSDDKTWLSCLRKADFKKILSVYKSATWAIEGTDFLPVSAHKAFASNKFNNDLELLVGVDRDEGSTLIQMASSVGLNFPNKTLTKTDFEAFVDITDKVWHNIPVKNVTEFYLKNVRSDDTEAIKWAFYDYYGDLLMKCPTYHFAKQYSRHSNDKSKVFFYENTYTAGKAVEKEFGVSHGAELPFVFGLPLIRLSGYPLPDGFEYTEDDKQFSQTLVEYWTNFAKHGSPDPNGDTWLSLSGTPIMPNVIKELNPKESKSYFIGLFDKTCDGVWSDYY